MYVVLDSGVAGKLVSPRADPRAHACADWFLSMLGASVVIAFPEIIDYEMRRTYLHRGMQAYVRRLERLIARTLYLPVTTPVMRRAAELWAEARRMGRKTADDKALDIDMILCAQVQILGERAGEKPVVATTNLAHLAPFVDAAPWEGIALPG